MSALLVHPTARTRPPLLVAEDVVVTAGAARLLDRVTMEAHAGEVLAVLGPNGAGKSTLLRAALGQARLAGGQVTWAGRPLAASRRAERARAIAVVSQRASMAFPMAALEVVLLGRTPHHRGVERDVDVATAWAALQATDVSHLARRRYPTLSGGEQRRVQLARALAQLWADGPPGGPTDRAPRLLVLDEPTADLDIGQAQRALALCRAEADRGAAVVAVLHDLNQAAAVADRLLVLARGRVVAAGPPAVCLTPPVLRRAYDADVDVLTLPDGRGPVLLPARSPRATSPPRSP